MGNANSQADSNKQAAQSPASASSSAQQTAAIQGAQDTGSLAARIAALEAENAKLMEQATAPSRSSNAPVTPDEIAEMTGLNAGNFNARDPNAPVPRHPATGVPYFNPMRPTGKG